MIIEEVEERLSQAVQLLKSSLIHPISIELRATIEGFIEENKTEEDHYYEQQPNG